MTLKQPSDRAARLAAVDPSRSFLVQAPAGSGKTELLTDRILALLATVNRPEEIVAITFTRKAASEMHARVLQKLASGAGPQPHEEYRLRSWELARRALQRNDELGWDLLHHPSRLSIRTIDAFCSHLVRAMPWLSSLGGMPGVAERAGTHYEAAAQATLAMADDHAAVAQLIDHLDVDMGQAVRMLANMLGQRDQWLPLLAGSSDLAQLVDNLDDAIHDDLANVADHMPAGWASALASPLRHAAHELAQAGKTGLADVLDGWDGSPFGTGPESVEQWQALARMLLTQTGTLRVKVDKNLGFPPKSAHKEAFVQWLASMDPAAPWVAALRDVLHIPAAGYTDEQQEIVGVLIQVLWLAAGQLQLRFIEAAEVDFIEISQRALQALGRPDEPTDLLLALDNYIRHILVDEFQDTSQSQIELLTRLTAGWMPGDGRTLFLVGDPMQSIYRFRKAEVGWFLHVKEHGLGPVTLEALELTDNFRSQGALVHAVNRLCAPIFPLADHVGLGAIRYTPSVPFNDTIAASDIEFHPVWVPKGAKGASAENGNATSDAVAVDLAREALNRYPDSPHPVAILVRARSHLNDIVLRLSQAGIPCRAVDLVTLKSRQVVIDLVQLARALSHPADRLAWLSVLRSPLCGLSLSAMHHLFGRDHHSSVPRLLERWLAQSPQPPSGHDPDHEARLREVAAILLDRGNASGTLPFAAWLEQCWNRLGGPAIYSSDSDRADAESLLRLIEQQAPYGNLNPAELEDSLDQLYAAPSSSGRAVEVMTIHKAKGLEFETVILVGLDNRGQADRPPLIRFEHSEGRLLLGPVKRSTDDAADPVSHYLSEREKRRAAYETDRLLYVALTRARSELHLVATVTVDDSGSVAAPAPSSLLARLWDGLDVPPPPAWDELKPIDSSETPAVKQRYLVRPIPPQERSAACGVQSAARSLSPDALDGDRPGGEGASGGAGGVSWVWRKRAHGERILGTVAHAWLERIGKEGLDAWPLERLVGCEDIFRKQLSRAGILPENLNEAVHVLHDTLAATMRSDKGRWLLQVARAYREWALLDLSGRVSVIDLAISQESDWLVVDYKTGVPGQGETSTEFARRMRTMHQEQLARYCGHVSALDGRPARGALFFPRADLWIDC